jgi:hypothetical protein
VLKAPILPVKWVTSWLYDLMKMAHCNWTYKILSMPFSSMLWNELELLKENRFVFSQFLLVLRWACLMVSWCPLFLPAVKHMRKIWHEYLENSFCPNLDGLWNQYQTLYDISQLRMKWGDNGILILQFLCSPALFSGFYELGNTERLFLYLRPCWCVFIERDTCCVWCFLDDKMHLCLKSVFSKISLLTSY